MSGPTDSETHVPGLTYACRSYGDHSLQRVGIWEFDSPQADGSRPWIIYIHGGAWRDPRKLHDGIVPTMKTLVGEGQVSKSSVRGFISIDYRLSPHPQFPQDPSSTPASEFRGARHPDHIQDIRSALAFLKESHQLSSNYILVGHSAGATLSYQLLMGSSALAGANAIDVPLPVSVVGISGIYDMVALVKRFGEQYDAFVSAAFGPDQAIWAQAAPATFTGSFKANWSGQSILAWSPQDSLIDEPEIDAMAAKLKEDGLSVTVLKDLTDDHDVVWEEGSQVARLITMALAQLS
ncbi:Kynurenine formamidase [Paramyrothecium foliicola]|nr:Kynurenine formamidase [Paramyrothecium foliicola]